MSNRQSVLTSRVLPTVLRVVTAVCLTAVGGAATAAPPTTDFYRIDTGGTGFIGVAPGAGDDVNSGGAGCTLRDAFDVASAGVTAGPVTGCDITAVGAADPTAPVYVVALPPGGYTYTLVPGLNANLDLSLASVYVVGDTPDNTIVQAAATSGTAESRVLRLIRATVELSNLTVRHGFYAYYARHDGGGISSSQGSLTLLNARVEDNGNRGRGGGIYHDSGTLTLLEGSLVQRNAPVYGSSASEGGGIYARGTSFLPSVVTIDASSVRDNVIVEGGEGGGVANAGMSTVIVQNGGRVENNEVSGLSGVNGGGGISNSGVGALVLIDGGVVAGNRVLGGFASGLGGGIYNEYYGTVRVVGGGVVGGVGAGNVAGRGSGIYNGFGGVVVIEDGVVSHNGVDPVDFRSAEGGGIYNTASLEIRHSDLSDNVAEQFSGGGLWNSGASAVATIEDSTLERNRSGALAFGYGGAIHNRIGGQVTVARSTLDDNEADLGGAAASFGAGSLLELANVTALGNTAYSAAAFLNDEGSVLRISDSVVGTTGQPNVASGYGGGVLNRGADSLAVLVGVRVDGNEAGIGGGLANAEGARLELTGGGIDGNQASSDAGGVHNDGLGTSMTLTDTTISGNATQGNGGAIENSKGASLEIAGSSLNGNQADGDGGAIRNDQGIGFDTSTSLVTLIDSELRGNVAGGAGGAISSESAYESIAVLDISATRIGGADPGDGNSAARGGAVHLLAQSETGENELTLRDGSRVEGNQASGDGGAFFFETGFRGPLTAVLQDVAIVGNDASGSGGAVYSIADSGGSTTLEIVRGMLSANRAGGQGGAIYTESLFNYAQVGTTTIEVSDSTLAANEAALEGGAVYHAQTSGVSSLLVVDAILSTNVASDGGALYHAGGTSQLDASCIQGNTDVAVVNAGAGVQDATGNYWGSSDGPGPVAPGSGDTISAGVDASGFATVPFEGCDGGLLQVAIDVRPFSRHNKINLTSRGLVPVALFGSDELDVGDVDTDTLRFEGAKPLRWKIRTKDIDRDGRPDLLTFYRIPNTEIEPGQTEACLTGETTGGELLEGCDTIQTTGWHHGWLCWLFGGHPGHGHDHGSDHDEDD